MKRRNRCAFTLIELMVAMAILGILAAISIPRFVRARYRAYQSACMQNERNLATALESYRTDHRFYPTTVGGLVQAGGGTISAIPSCPSAPGTQYTYEVNSDGDGFSISCVAGFHEHQINGQSDGYPQYQAGLGVREFP